MDKDKAESKSAVDSDVKEIFVSESWHTQQALVQHAETQIIRQRNRANCAPHHLPHHPAELAMDPTVGSAMEKFRQFSGAFADYPVLQESLSLKDGPANGKLFTVS